jgi:hypothetical protein
MLMSAKRSGKPRDVHLDAGTLAAAKGMIAHLSELQVNTDVKTWMSGAVQDCEPKLIPLTGVDEQILMTLAAAHPTAKHARDIEVEERIAHVKMVERVTYLKQHKLIYTPHGERSGLNITDFGLRHVQKRRTQTTP